ncbi:MAG: hypothetical protein Q7R96_03410 [Nanoarchaeota archaeon]|nr:hypothetical protein [Nanoarchaeota archaeon]
MEYGIPVLITTFIYIVVIIMTMGVANIGAHKDADYYNSALEINLQRTLTCIAASDGYHQQPGIIDPEKITLEHLETCIQNPYVGIKITLGNAPLLATPYYEAHASSCAVEKKPYSCATKRLRILTKNNQDAYLPQDIIIAGIIEHTTGKEAITRVSS